jgi:hypothetical protein
MYAYFKNNITNSCIVDISLWCEEHYGKETKGFDGNGNFTWYIFLSLGQPSIRISDHLDITLFKLTWFNEIVLAK